MLVFNKKKLTVSKNFIGDMNTSSFIELFLESVTSELTVFLLTFKIFSLNKFSFSTDADLWMIIFSFLLTCGLLHLRGDFITSLKLVDCDVIGFVILKSQVISSISFWWRMFISSNYYKINMFQKQLLIKFKKNKH